MLKSLVSHRHRTTHTETSSQQIIPLLFCFVLVKSECVLILFLFFFIKQSAVILFISIQVDYIGGFFKNNNYSESYEIERVV